MRTQLAGGLLIPFTEGWVAELFASMYNVYVGHTLRSLALVHAYAYV
jgi:hypothetical protein